MADRFLLVQRGQRVSRSHPRPARLAIVLAATMAAAVFGLAACSTSGSAGAESSSTIGTVGPGTGAPLTFLHVVIPTNGANRTPYLADPAGRQVLLRGVAAVGLQDVAYPTANGGPAIFPVNSSAYDGKCPKATARIPQPPLCEVQASLPAYRQSIAPGSGDDFAQMRSLGFDVVRLVLNWSQLEPSPGHYSTTYVNRISQVVSWARQQGIYVILDMHQDQYSRYILPAKKTAAPSGCSPSGGSDGAPRWAVFTDGKPGCAVDGQSALNPASSAAFYNFWHNHPVPAPKGQAPGSGLQDHYIGALATLARRFEHDSAVLGYELMNEPQPGSLTALPLTNLYQASSQDLYPFYRRAIEALTGVRDGLPTCPASQPTSLKNTCAYPKLADVTHQQIFFEPLAYRNLIDFSPQVSTPFSSYPNLVYAPHVYTHAFTVDQFIGYPATDSPYPPTYTFGYQTAESEAQAMHAAVFTTEFGDASSTDSFVLAGETAAEEATLTGGTLWAWKGLSATEATCWCVRWQHSSYQTTANGTPGTGNPRSPVSPDDQLIPSRALYMERVWPRATAGRLLSYQYDPTDRSFAMVASDTHEVRRGDRADETVVYIPATVHGKVTVTGAASLDAVVAEPDGSRDAYIAPSGSALATGTAGTAGFMSTAHSYEVTVGQPPAPLVATVASEASSPLQPIAEPQARQAAESALQTALASTNPKIHSNAVLANLLAGILLGSNDPNTSSEGAP